jgi:hypothetical protein
MRMFIFVLIAPLLAACASAKERAAADDATCLGYGAKPGSDAYAAASTVAPARSAAPRQLTATENHDRATSKLR